MRFILRLFLILFTLLILPITIVKNSFAALTPESFGVQSSIGTISSIEEAFIWVINLLVYVGWAGMIVGIVVILCLLIYKLIFVDDNETMKSVQGGITKVMYVIVLGFLLLSAAFLVKLVADLMGVTGLPSLVPRVFG
jgi:hypothetical protein